VTKDRTSERRNTEHTHNIWEGEQTDTTAKSVGRSLCTRHDALAAQYATMARLRSFDSTSLRVPEACLSVHQLFTTVADTFKQLPVFPFLLKGN
jgi:hypothetical protein